jgi:hypothetical protein
MSTEDPEVPAEEEETDDPEFGDSEPDDAVDASDD